jgi:hypothetical protein
VTQFALRVNANYHKPVISVLQGFVWQTGSKAFAPSQWRQNVSLWAFIAVGLAYEALRITRFAMSDCMPPWCPRYCSRNSSPRTFFEQTSLADKGSCPQAVAREGLLWVYFVEKLGKK